MVKCYKLESISSLNLSQACLVLGLLDLAINLFVVIIRSINLHEHHGTLEISTLTMSAIGTYTCSVMIIGSHLKNRWLLLPHIAYETLVFGIVGVLGLICTVVLLKDGLILETVLLITIVCLILVFLVFYWKILVNRYQEIKEQRSPFIDLVEIE